MLIRTWQGSVIPANAAAGETLHQMRMQMGSGFGVPAPVQQGVNSVSVQLTAFAIVQPSAASTMLTYQPAVTSTKVGATVQYNQFDYIDQMGFSLNFEFRRNTFTIQRCDVFVNRSKERSSRHFYVI
jgi:hypothetical protein